MEIREDDKSDRRSQKGGGSTSTNMNVNEVIALMHLGASLKRKAVEFKDVMKASRTCLQDAVPITLGQEFGGYHSFVRRHIALLDGMMFVRPLEF